MTKGLYIVIEGQDGTGKSTQAELLAKYLREQGREVVSVSEGAKTDSGLAATDDINRITHIRDYALEPATNLLLFTAAWVELWNKQIAPALAAGKVVVQARNWWSALAFQHFGQGVPRQEIENLTRRFLPERYVSPDKAIILTLDDTERVRRMSLRDEDIARDTFDSKKASFFSKVNHGYGQIARDFNVPIVDANGTIDEISQKIIKSILP